MAPRRSDEEVLELAATVAEQLRRGIAEVVVGQREVVEQMLITLVTGGHALLVGVPGLAKTLLVASLAQALELSFGRVQFTPDLLPADITGTDVLQEHEGKRTLKFMPGPIFQNLILADEINRTPPKTQAALLEAMQERQVTVGNETHLLPQPFQVFATRNPIELEGTYPLPEAQRDRFLLEIRVGYPTVAEERAIALRVISPQSVDLAPIGSKQELAEITGLVPRIPITEEAVATAVTLCRATRPDDLNAPEEVRRYVRYGAGPRGSQALVLAARALAALHGRAAADV
ncbi:MAG: AAA family ATPase, partial [Deltaproteobacteria bacterium]|nr:AAA family ATPase [Deltaproteobacteria bacterium]MBW2534678.1 AAA family ATPase [Deltaproteobacteria bacterium]